MKKKQYCQANCYDAERAFFDIDTYRRGFIDLDMVRIYSLDKNFFLVQNLHRHTLVTKHEGKTWSAVHSP